MDALYNISIVFELNVSSIGIVFTDDIRTLFVRTIFKSMNLKFGGKFKTNYEPG